MDFEKEYVQEFNRLRIDNRLLEEYSLLKSTDSNKNQIKRNRILIALFNDIRTSDFRIVDFMFNEEEELRKSANKVEGYEVDPLYLAAFLLTQIGNIDVIWKFIDTKRIDFDSSIGFDLEYLYAFGVEETVDFVRNSNHLNKEKAIRILGLNNPSLPFTQNEIDEWKKWKSLYFSVFKFPIKDKINFAFQAKEYEELRKEVPNWMSRIDEWSEEQFINSITIGKILGIKELHLKALRGYVKRFDNPTRIKYYKKDIEKLESENKIGLRKLITSLVHQIYPNKTQS